MYNVYNSFTLPCLHVVINLQEQCDGLCRELDCACRHQQRLHNVLLQDIRDLSLFTNVDIAFKVKGEGTKTHLPNVDAGIALPKSVTVAKLGDDRDGVEPGILRERRRDDLERVSVCLEAVRLHASQRLRILRQHAGYVDLRCATSTNQRAARNAKEVSEGRGEIFTLENASRRTVS